MPADIFAVIYSRNQLEARHFLKALKRKLLLRVVLLQTMLRKCFLKGWGFLSQTL